MSCVDHNELARLVSCFFAGLSACLTVVSTGAVVVSAGVVVVNAGVVVVSVEMEYRKMLFRLETERSA